jgi:hypothetical protein
VATARETLYDEITALTKGAPTDESAGDIKKIMSRYRVQTKPGVNIADGITARDALGDRLLDMWKGGGDDLDARIGAAIDEFRMQVKAKPAGGKAKARTPKPRAPKPAAKATPEVPATADEPDASDGKGEPAAARQPRAQPVAGGPRKRGKTRGECPKCHSMGVVLAQSYSGDEYYSCIYCGWQAFKPADENDPAASLAVRLLGQSGGGK